MIKEAQQRQYANESGGGLGQVGSDAVALGQRYGLQAGAGLGVGMGVHKMLKDTPLGKFKLGGETGGGKKYMASSSKLLGLAAGTYAAKKLNDIIRKKNRREQQ